MADAHGETHGGKRRNSGRKRKHSGSTSSQLNWNARHKRLYLSIKIFETWKESKIVAGYGSSTDSDFAAHLLSLEYRRRADSESIPYLHKPPHPQEITTSTPVKRGENLPDSSAILESPILLTIKEPLTLDYCLETDANSTLSEHHGRSTIEQLNTSLFTDDELETSSEENSSDYDFREPEQSAMLELDDERGLDDEEETEDEMPTNFNYSMDIDDSPLEESEDENNDVDPLVPSLMIP